MALRARPVANPHFLHFACERAGGIQSQLGGALDAIHGGRFFGQLHQFAPIWGDKQTPIGLQISSDLAERSQFVGRVKEQHGSQPGMVYGGDERSIRHFIR